MQQDDKWSTLLMKAINKTLTPSEQVEFDRQCASSNAKTKQYQQLKSPRYWLNRLKDMQNIDTDNSWHQIQKKAARKNCTS